MEYNNEPSIPIPSTIYVPQVMLHYPPHPPPPSQLYLHHQQQIQHHIQQQIQQQMQHMQMLQHHQHQAQQHSSGDLSHLKPSAQTPTASSTSGNSSSNPTQSGLPPSISRDDQEDEEGDVEGEAEKEGDNKHHQPYKSSHHHSESLKVPSAAHRCTQLTLQQKVEVLQMIDQKVPYREIAKQFNIAHSTISGIKKTKHEIYQLVNQRANLSMHRIHKSMPITSKLLDERMYAWYLSNRNQNITINGRQLQQKALEIAKELNLPDFKASNGWLDSFKRRHQILLKHHTDI